MWIGRRSSDGARRGWHRPPCQLAGQRGPVLAGLLGGEHRVVLVGMLLEVRLDVGDGVLTGVELAPSAVDTLGVFRSRFFNC